MKNNLIVLTDHAVTIFGVDKDSGSLRQIDSLDVQQASAMAADFDDVIVTKSQGGAVALWLSDGKLHSRPASAERVNFVFALPRGRPGWALDPENKLMYFADPNRSELLILRAEPRKRMTLLPNAYPLPRAATTDLTLINP